LKPDGSWKAKRQSENRKKDVFPIIKNFDRKEVMRNYAFWIFALFLAMQGLYVTGLTFHIISIFENAGLDKQDAISVFQPMAAISVIVTLSASSLSDYIKLKYLLYIMGIGACLGILGMIFLKQGIWAYYLLIGGNGVLMGLFSVLSSVTWPRYFGRRHLGAISGQSVMMVVFGSALGPILFSLSFTHLGDYRVAGGICLSIFFLLTILAFWVHNPQRALNRSSDPEASS
jgi:cyanate permease